MSAAAPHSPSKRTNKLCQPGLQIRLASRFVGVVLVALGLQAALVTVLLLRHAGQLGPEGNALAAIVPEVMLWSCSATFVLLVPLLLWVGIVLTHKTAGPIGRIETFLVGVIEGDEIERLRTREGDELRGLAELINETVQPLLEANRAAARSAYDSSNERGPGSAPLRSAA